MTVRLTRRHGCGAFGVALMVHGAALLGFGGLATEHARHARPRMLVSIQRLDVRERAPVPLRRQQPEASREHPRPIETPKIVEDAAVADPTIRRPIEQPAERATRAQATVEPTPNGAHSLEAASSSSVPRASSAAAQSEAVQARYLQLLAAWLDAHKHYPHRARELELEATVVVRVRIAADGSVISYALLRRGPFAVLAAAVEDMVERSDPFPAVPSGLAVAVLEFDIPVEFAIGTVSTAAASRSSGIGG